MATPLKTLPPNCCASAPALRAALEAKKASDVDFAGDGDAQLNWLFKQTEYYELRHRRYPVYKLF